MPYVFPPQITWQRDASCRDISVLLASRTEDPGISLSPPKPLHQLKSNDYTGWLLTCLLGFGIEALNFFSTVRIRNEMKVWIQDKDHLTLQIWKVYLKRPVAAVTKESIFQILHCNNCNTHHFTYGSNTDLSIEIYHFRLLKFIIYQEIRCLAVVSINYSEMPHPWEEEGKKDAVIQQPIHWYSICLSISCLQQRAC